jgi:hypothetical protein
MHHRALFRDARIGLPPTSTLTGLDRETLTKLLDRTPRLAREIGSVMEQRRQASLASRKNGSRSTAP